MVKSYRGHGNLALETPADGIVNTLGLAPRRRDTLEAVRLMAVEAVGAYPVHVSPHSLSHCRNIEFQLHEQCPPTASRVSSAKSSQNKPKSTSSTNKQNSTSFAGRRAMLSRPGSVTFGNREHTLLHDGDVLLRGDHLGQNVSTAIVEMEIECRNSLCRCCRVSPGDRVLSSRDRINLENFTPARASGRPTLVRFERSKRIVCDYVTLGLDMGCALPRLRIWDL